MPEWGQVTTPGKGTFKTQPWRVQQQRPSARQDVCYLVITNTLFRLSTRNKTSWMQPRSKLWNLIDYVSTRKRVMQNARVMKAMCGAGCWTDHRLIVSKCKLRILPVRRPQGQKTAKRLDVSKLKSSKVAEEFSSYLDGRLPDLRTTLKTSGWPSETHTTLLPLNISEKQPAKPAGLVRREQRRHTGTAFRETPTVQNIPKRSHVTSKDGCLCQRKKKRAEHLREMQETWFSSRVDEIQGYADCHDVKRF
ncbi:hypothetical protein ACOMHN_056912 [Nucella lapillus]